MKKVRDNSELNQDEIVEIQSTSKTSMDKNTSGNSCNFCGRGFKTSQGLDRHIQDKHEKNVYQQEYDCTLCGDGFIREQELNSHVLECIKHNTQIVKCPHCKENFTKGALKRHTELGKCIPQTEQANVRNHSNVNHTNEVKSKTVCRHWRTGNCFRGNKCMFAHVGFQQVAPSNNFTTESANTAAPKIFCRNGSQCIWLARGRCTFFHQENQRMVQQGGQEPRQGGQRMGQGFQQWDQRGQQGGQGSQQGGQGGQQGGLRTQRGGQVGQQMGWRTQTKGDCWFQEECKRSFCTFNHRYQKDFPNINNRRSNQ